MRLRLPVLFVVFSFSCGVAAQADPAQFACTIQPDKQTVRVTIKNPFETETQCMVNCEISTQRAGTKFLVSCGRPVKPGVEGELCVKKDDEGTLVSMIGGDGDCIKPLPPEPAEEKKDDDDDALIQKMMKDSQDFIDKSRSK